MHCAILEWIYKVTLYHSHLLYIRLTHKIVTVEEILKIWMHRTSEINFYISRCCEQFVVKQPWPCNYCICPNTWVSNCLIPIFCQVKFKIVILQRWSKGENTTRTKWTQPTAYSEVWFHSLFECFLSTHSACSQLLLKVCRPFVLMFDSDAHEV